MEASGRFCCASALHLVNKRVILPINFSKVNRRRADVSNSTLQGPDIATIEYRPDTPTAGHPGPRPFLLRRNCQLVRHLDGRDAGGAGHGRCWTLHDIVSLVRGGGSGGVFCFWSRDWVGILAVSYHWFASCVDCSFELSSNLFWCRDIFPGRQGSSYGENKVDGAPAGSSLTSLLLRSSPRF